MEFPQNWPVEQSQHWLRVASTGENCVHSPGLQFHRCSEAAGNEERTDTHVQKNWDPVDWACSHGVCLLLQQPKPQRVYYVPPRGRSQLV